MRVSRLLEMIDSTYSTDVQMHTEITKIQVSLLLATDKVSCFFDTRQLKYFASLILVRAILFPFCMTCFVLSSTLFAGRFDFLIKENHPIQSVK